MSPIIFSERDGGGGGGGGVGGGEQKMYLHLHVNNDLIHQSSRYYVYTLKGRVNKPLDMCLYIFMLQFQ